MVFLFAQAGIITLLVGMPEDAVDRSIFCREYSTAKYRLISYAIVKVISEIILAMFSAIVFLVIVYWSTNLQGRFSVWFAIIVLYGLASGALGTLLMSFPDDPMIAIQSAPLPVLTPMLLAGFIVSYDELPSWMHWAVAIQGLTYAFRLLLHEELKKCTELTPDGQDFVKCGYAMFSVADDFVNLGLDEAFSKIYTEESVLTVPVAGRYEGTKGIIEYLNYFRDDEGSETSLLWNFCPVCLIPEKWKSFVNKS